MGILLNLLIAIVALASGPMLPWNIDLLSGEWGMMHENGPSAGSFQYFRFDPDKGAVWVHSHKDEGPTYFEFPAEGIVEDNGIVIFTANPSDGFMVRFVVSAYRISEYKDTGLATGYLYMFQELEGDWVLFNSIPFRGRPLEPDDPIYSHEHLRPLIEK